MSLQEYTTFAPLETTLRRSEPGYFAHSTPLLNKENYLRATVCLLLLSVLMIWAVVWPQTGDGDAIMHFLNAHDGLWQPSKLMGSWARVGAKLPLLIPAQAGVLGARWMSAFISIICAWQTIRLADDLKLRRAILAAPMLIFQPFVFGLAGDTMTEMPFALGLVVAIRLWWRERTLASCLVMGYLPLVRPEGFFLVLLWGLMTLAMPNRGSPGKRIAIVTSLSWGTIAWFFGCLILHHDATYCFRGGWAWPADSLKLYGRGSFFAYANRLPIYCGPVLFILFLMGMDRLRSHRRLIAATAALLLLELYTPGWFREKILPWPALVILGWLAWSRRKEKIAVAWWSMLLIFTLHSVLWWRGWFASCGLMRILACASPVVAVICLRGWNLIADWLADREVSLNVRRAMAGIAISVMALSAAGFYLIDPLHERIFPLEKACDFVRQNHLLDSAPAIIFGDPMAQAALQLPPNPPNLLLHVADRAEESRRLLAAPIGSIGLWDNQHAQAWFNVKLEDLPVLGYSILHEVDQTTLAGSAWLQTTTAPRKQIYVVIRKDRPGKLPSDIFQKS